MSILFLSAFDGHLINDSKTCAVSAKNRIVWSALPSAAPAVVRNCPKCKAVNPFRSSGLFRVNANGRSIDVWLVYRCESCDTSWNMDVLSRVSPSSIDRESYTQYTKNDPSRALACAFDRALHRKNRIHVDYTSFDVMIEGDDIDLEHLRSPLTIVLSSDYELEIKAEVLLAKKLGVSRSQFRKFVESGKITFVSGDLRKQKLIRPVEITVKP